VHVELLHDPGAVGSDGLFTDGKVLCDGPARIPTADTIARGLFAQEGPSVVYPPGSMLAYAGNIWMDNYSVSFSDR
jgi:hypothetical protein